MENKWSDAEIYIITDIAKNKFKTNIPLAQEIIDLNTFISDIKDFTYKTDRFNFEFNIKFNWLCFCWHRVKTIDVPKDIVQKVLEEARVILDNKCDELSELINYK